MEPKLVTLSNKFKSFQNKECPFFPCHDVELMKRPEEFNCLFCYCPLQYLECPGPYVVFKDVDGIVRKDCTACVLPHDGFEKSWKFIQRWLRKPVQWDWKSERVENDYTK